MTMKICIICNEEKEEESGQNRRIFLVYGFVCDDCYQELLEKIS